MKAVVILVLFILVAGAIASRELRSCNSCGRECETSCGTRNFKTCCFNYMKKRSSGDTDSLPDTMDPSLRLELWLAKSRYPLYQKYYEDVQEIAKERRLLPAI